jgi:3-oxoacyl-[acyl-carrier-protein] synthase II
VADRNRVSRRDVALANVIRGSLRKSGAEPKDVAFVHAHGLSTHASDKEEAQAIRQVFGSAADRLPVVASKSHFGNLGAGSGAVELIASLLALHHGRLFPVLNYQTPDPECPISPVTTNDRPAGKSFINLSVNARGQASGLLVRAVD